MSEVSLIKAEFMTSPERVGMALRETAFSLELNKQAIEEIKKKNPIKGIFSYKALAEALLEQNKSISSFSSILQSVLLLQANNIEALTLVMESLCVAETTDEQNECEYITLAKECLAEAILSAKKNAETERKVLGMEDDLRFLTEKLLKNQLYTEQMEKRLRRQERFGKVLLGVCVGVCAMCVVLGILAIV